jgi:hypothetical protein
VRARQGALVLLLFLIFVIPGATTGREPHVYQPVGGFTAVEVTPSTAPRPRPTPTVAPSPSLAPSVEPSTRAAAPTPEPKAESRATSAIRTSRSITGKASWYCKAGVSVCHYKYPPGSMVAAACGKLRAAIGPKWRGKTVVVTRLDTGKSVQIKLVDYCASKDKTIDLYWAVMARLGGTGVLRVKVAW